MITKEQANELRRLIGAHTATQVSVAQCGTFAGEYISNASITNCCNLLEFISSITEYDSWDIYRRPGGEWVVGK